MQQGSFSPGQALIEAILAFAIVSVVLVALLQLSNRSVSNSGESSRQALATNFATEGLQWIKDQRALLGWDEFVAHCGAALPCTQNNLCLNVLSWTANCATNPQIAGTEYNRLMSLSGAVAGGKQQITATVTVSWVEEGRTVSAKQWFVFVQR